MAAGAKAEADAERRAIIAADFIMVIIYIETLDFNPMWDLRCWHRTSEKTSWVGVYDSSQPSRRVQSSEYQVASSHRVVAYDGSCPLAYLSISCVQL